MKKKIIISILMIVLLFAAVGGVFVYQSNANKITSISKKDVEEAAEFTLSDFDFVDGYKKTRVKTVFQTFKYSELLIAKLNDNKGADSGCVVPDYFESCEKDDEVLIKVKTVFGDCNAPWIDEMESSEITWYCHQRPCEVTNIKLSVPVYMLENKTTNEYYVIFDQTGLS